MLFLMAGIYGGLQFSPGKAFRTLTLDKDFNDEKPELSSSQISIDSSGHLGFSQKLSDRTYIQGEIFFGKYIRGEDYFKFHLFGGAKVLFKYIASDNVDVFGGIGVAGIQTQSLKVKLGDNDYYTYKWSIESENENKPWSHHKPKLTPFFLPTLGAEWKLNYNWRIRFNIEGYIQIKQGAFEETMLVHVHKGVKEKYNQEIDGDSSQGFKGAKASIGLFYYGGSK